MTEESKVDFKKRLADIKKNLTRTHDPEPTTKPTETLDKKKTTTPLDKKNLMDKTPTPDTKNTPTNHDKNKKTLTRIDPHPLTKKTRTQEKPSKPDKKTPILTKYLTKKRKFDGFDDSEVVIEDQNLDKKAPRIAGKTDIESVKTRTAKIRDYFEKKITLPVSSSNNSCYSNRGAGAGVPGPLRAARPGGGGGQGDAKLRESPLDACARIWEPVTQRRGLATTTTTTTAAVTGQSAVTAVSNYRAAYKQLREPTNGESQDKNNFGTDQRL